MMFTRKILPFLLIVVLALFSLLPEQVVSHIYSAIAKHLFSFDAWQKSYANPISNAGHLAGYGVLALAFRSLWTCRWWVSGLLSLIIAATLEAAQLLVPTRQASFGDLGFDIIGVGIAMLIFGLVERNGRRVRGGVVQ